MQKASPLILVLILISTAVFLSLRDPNPQASPAPPTKETQSTPDQATVPEVPTTKATALPAKPWAHQLSDIAPDPKAVFGSLPNGFRYIIYPNSEPPTRLSVRLHIQAGSLMEADDQRGLAHFLEHMMFNGTKNYSADDIIPRMQRLGIAFGAHANAYTSFDETVYMLDIPDLSEETLQLAFNVMRDFGDAALLTAEEIDKERGVILSEKLSRDSVDFRLMEKQFSTLLPDSLISHRFPIGIEDVIKNAPRQRFVDLYQQYYTPQRMTFVVVGDIDPKVMEDRIKTTFESMQNPEQAGAEPDLGKVTPPKGIKPSIFQDPEVSSTEVSILLARPYQTAPDTRKDREKELTVDIAHSIISRRIERLTKQKDSPVKEGSASHSRIFNAIELGSISMTAANDDWQKVVPLLETEFRKALEFGFTEAELAEAKSNIANAAEQEVEQKPSRKSDDLATGIASSLNDQIVFSTPETDLEIIRNNLEGIDTAACLNAFRAFWKADGYHLILTTKQASDADQQKLLSLYNESLARPVTAPAARAIQVFDYTNFGSPGEVVGSSIVKDLGITQLTLSNQIRVNLKPTDFEKGKIRIVARIGSGQLSQPKDTPMLNFFAQSVFEGGGLGKHSNDDLQRILAGKNVSSTLQIGEDAFILSGSTTPQDFITQCQIMCASITDPGFREEALWQFKKSIPTIEQQLKHTPAGPSKQAKGWLHGGDFRYSLASMDKLGAYTINEAKSWLMPELTKGYLELSIIGDFDPKAVTADLLATFGALPKRAKEAAAMNEVRKIKFPNAPARKTFSYQSKIPQGIATAYWQTSPLRGNARKFRRLNILADILGDRLREQIREKLGASYSPNAGALGSDALDNVGYIASQSIGKPADLELLHETMREQADQLANKGATKDELDRSLKPVIGILEQTKRDNNYWLNTVMSQSQQDPDRLELARSRDQDYKSISLNEINALAKKYLAAENILNVSIQSE